MALRYWKGRTVAISICLYTLFPRNLQFIRTGFPSRLSILKRHVSECISHSSSRILCVLRLSYLVVPQALEARAGPYPKEPDIIECDPADGEGLDAQSCLEAMETMPDGLRFTKYTSHKQYPGQTALETPVFYYDNMSKE